MVWLKLGPMARTVIASYRNSAYMAQLSRAAESIALMGEGASACASGSQLCMGMNPTLVPYPTATKTKPSLTRLETLASSGPAFTNAVQSRAAGDAIPDRTAARYRAI